MKQKLSFLLIALVMSLSAFAQSNNVKGIVVDKEGIPLPGVTVKVDGTSKGGVTDINGGYVIQDVPSGATLEFTFVGMKTLRMKASPDMRVTLEDDFKNLDDVVVIGFMVRQRLRT